jgi:S1-C subfamily serine protease
VIRKDGQAGLRSRGLLCIAFLAVGAGVWPSLSAQAEIPDAAIQRHLDVPANIDLITPADHRQVTQLEQAIKQAAASTLPSVVGLRINLPGSVRGGTGAIISSDGYIITAAHVIEEPGRRCWVYLADGTALRGRTLGQHMEGPIDYGLIKCDPKGAKLPVINFGNSDALEQGQWVLSLGHTLGIETSPFRPPSVRAGRVMTNFGPLVETDATLNGGDSGGPLIDLRGNLVGINVATGDSPDENSSTAINITKGFIGRLKDEIRLGRELWPNDFGTSITNAYSLLDQGRFSEAPLAFQDCIDAQPHLGDGYYHLACCYVRQGTNSKDEIQQEQFHDLALETLEVAVARGWAQINHIASDPDMQPIRMSRRFRDILNVVRRNCGQQASLGLEGVADEGGLRITRLDPFGTARGAGVDIDDVLLLIGGQRIRNLADLKAAELSYRPNDEITLTVSHAEKRSVIECKMGGRWPESSFRKRVSKDDLNFREAMLSKTGTISDSVVQVSRGGSTIGYGLAVHRDGFIVGKYSDLVFGDEPLVVIGPNGRRFDAQVVAHDKDLDLGLLKIETENLKPIIFATGQKPEVGSFVFAVGNAATPLSVGVRSLGDYISKIGRSDRPFLGVVLARGDSEGVEIISVRENTGASYARLRAEDVITAVDGVEVKTRQGLIDLIRDRAIGEKVELKFTRNGVTKTVTASLGRLPGVGADAGGAPRKGHRALSRRTSGFGRVIQHDGIVYPEQCGSALVDVEGRVIGMNISRSDQTKTYALPADVLHKATKRLITEASAY